MPWAIKVDSRMNVPSTTGILLRSIPATTMSSASITGLAVLENVRKIDGKTFEFDAQFFVNDVQTIVAGLHYFNIHSFQLEELATYMVCAHVSVSCNERVVERAADHFF
jgi:hypothetical protein